MITNWLELIDDTGNLTCGIRRIPMKIENDHYKEKDMGPLFDLAESRQLRDEGITKVSDHNESWLDQCVSYVTNTIIKHEFTGEDIRFECANNVGFPKHHNAWGALINVLVKRNIIHPTGEHRPMKDKDSHARSTPVYAKT